VSEPDSRVETHADPTPETALAAAERAIEHGALLTLFGRCSVAYDGRASSVLEPGDRHLMCKPDGSVLVHTDEGQKPVNWQPPGCVHDPSIEDGAFVLRSTRENPAEELVVRFERIDYLAAFAVTDESDITLTGSEADLRDRILDEPTLIEAGFRPLATERGTAAGAVDVYGEDGRGRPVVLELKRRRVGPSAVGQLDRYVDALRREMHTDAEIRGILVAPSVTERARDLLAAKGLEFVALEP
jgi:endonuclease